MSLIATYFAFLKIVFGCFESGAYAFEGTGESGCLLVFLQYFSKVLNEFTPTHYFVVVKLTQKPTPTNTALSIHLYETGNNGGKGKCMGLLVEWLMMKVSDETGVVVGIEEILLVDACSHELQHLL